MEKSENLQSNSDIENGISVSPVDPVDPMEPILYCYSNPAGAEFPVISYDNTELAIENGNTIKMATDDELNNYLKIVEECGFNVILWTNGRPALDSLYNRCFDIAKSNKLASILNVSGMTPIKQGVVAGNVVYNPTASRLANVLNLYKKNSNLWGFLLSNNFKYVNWGLSPEEIPNKEANFKLAYTTFKDNVKNKMGFFNLPASIDQEWTGIPCDPSESGTSKRSKYYSYLTNIYTEFNKPFLLSANLYPIIKDKETLPTFVKRDYYIFLEAIGSFSHEKGVPFWLYMLSNEHMIFDKDGMTIKNSYPSPSEDILRFQAMNALAHGIKGLIFWTYGMPRNKWHDDDHKLIAEAYVDAPFANVYKTKIWDYCQTVIKEIKFYGKELLQAEFMGVKHVYGPDQIIADGVSLFSSPFGCISSATADKKGYVITHLNGPKFDYMAIVSHDWEEEQSITVNIAPGYSWLVMKMEDDSHDNKPENLRTGANSVTYILKPGGMLLIRYQKEIGLTPIQ